MFDTWYAAAEYAKQLAKDAQTVTAVMTTRLGKGWYVVWGAEAVAASDSDYFVEQFQA